MYREQLFKKVFDVVDKHPLFMEVTIQAWHLMYNASTPVAELALPWKVDETPLAVDDYEATLTVSQLLNILFGMIGNACMHDLSCM